MLLRPGRLVGILLSALVSSAVYPVRAVEIVEISIAERKPPCISSSQGRCWHTQLPVWKHEFDREKRLLIASPESRAADAARMTDTLIVRLPGLFVPIVFPASRDDSPLSVRLRQQTACQTSEQEGPNCRTSTLDIEFRQGARTQVLPLQPETWQALHWPSLKVPPASRTDSTRSTLDRPDFYFRIRLENDSISH